MLTPDASLKRAFHPMRRPFALPLLAVLGAASCAAEPEAENRVVAVIPVAERAPLVRVGETTVRNGGFGSGMSRLPSGEFVLLTDRGPNYEYRADTKAFPVPDFQPGVGLFTSGDGPGEPTLELVGFVPFTDSTGTPMNGLPPPSGPGATGETAVDTTGSVLAPDRKGLDSEGVHVLADGSFWIAEEYGPNLIHYDRAGRLIARIGPRESGHGLPAVLARRRPNRGFEGLTGDSSGTVLVALLQSPLDNPEPAGRRSVQVRIVFFHPADGTSRQFLYQLEDPESFVSDITWLSPTAFLVIEQDEGFKAGDPPSVGKRVYRVDLSTATDVSDAAKRPEGRMVGERTLEQLSPNELGELGIVPGVKTLVVDLLALGYPHDKAEGIVVLDRTEIAIVNDDDFGIVSGPGGLPAPKLLPGTSTVDSNELWIIRLARPLW